MANCKTCGEFFQPTTDEERLIATHLMPEICMLCAEKATQDHNKDWKPPSLFEPIGKFDGTKLHRADWFDKDEQRICFVARPPRPRLPRHRTLRKPRKGNIHVTIIGSSDAYRMTSEPRVIVHTNIATFMKSRQPFWVSKIPDFWDPHTGIGRIEIPLDKVDHVSDDEREVHLKDGGVVRLIYKQKTRLFTGKRMKLHRRLLSL